MAKIAKARHGVSIRFVCRCFVISETCYRYQPKLSDDNALIADWLLRLTTANRRWGFGAGLPYLPGIGTKSSNQAQTASETG
jgi:putative transposase